MRILIIGADGQLGNDLVEELRDYELVTPDLSDLDITRYKETNRLLLSIQPDVVINTAAYHGKDREKYPLKTLKINAFAVKNLVDTLKEIDCPLVQISTGDIFRGKPPYTEKSLPSPQSYYGMSKFLAEMFIEKTYPNYWIIRTSFLFGKAGCKAKKRKNLISTLAEAIEKGKVIAKTDEVISICYTRDLAKAIHEIIIRYPYGKYNIVNRGKASIYQIAQEIMKITKSKAELIGVSGRKQPNRPKKSYLDTKTNLHLPSWKNALKRYFYEISQNKGFKD